MASVTVDMDVIDLRNAASTPVRGRHVDNLQGLLKGTRNGTWDPGPVDGVTGARTRAAVLAFQRDNALTQDGVVGARTWSALIPFGP